MARKSKGKPQTKQTANSPKLLKAIEKALKKYSRRQKAKYNGVVGSLPEWVPSPLNYEFVEVRRYLLDKYKSKEVLKYKRARNRMFRKKGFRGLPYYPDEIEDKLDALNYIETLVKIGEKNGKKAAYDAYLGKGGIQVVRGVALSEIGSKGGKKRAGQLNPLCFCIYPEGTS